jgi:Transcription termination factor nusG
MSSPWLVVVTEPQQEYPTVWRCHLLGLEVFTPVIRRRIRTGRVRNGHHITRLVARPMFPSYGFVRQSEVRSPQEILAMRGVRDFLRNERDELATLPHEAIVEVVSPAPNLKPALGPPRFNLLVVRPRHAAREIVETLPAMQEHANVIHCRAPIGGRNPTRRPCA